jgi:hypothetical protein
MAIESPCGSHFPHFHKISSFVFCPTAEDSRVMLTWRVTFKTCCVSNAGSSCWTALVRLKTHINGRGCTVTITVAGSGITDQESVESLSSLPPLTCRRNAAASCACLGVEAVLDVEPISLVLVNIPRFSLESGFAEGGKFGRSNFRFTGCFWCGGIVIEYLRKTRLSTVSRT